MPIGVRNAALPSGEPAWRALVTDELPAVVSACGTPDFGARLVTLLQRVVAFEWWMVMVYRLHAHPQMLAENFTGSWRERGLTTYVNAYYLLDPFYLVSLALTRPEVCRLVDIAPDGFRDSEYHRAHYATGRIGDEVNCLYPLEPGITLAVSLERSEPGPRFDEADVARLEALQPVLAAIARQHWRAAHASGSAVELALGHVVQAAAESFGQDVLTPRECEVVKLVLRGYSTKSASQALGISPGTVKVHRENIYAKLGVSSQAELFNLFIDSVTSAPKRG